MRYLNGTPPHVANSTIDSYMLTKHMVSDPDILPGITRLWRNDLTPLSAILADRGMFSKKLANGVSNDSYKVVSQNHVQFRIESSDRKIVRLTKSPTGVTFLCDAYPTAPGKNQSVVSIWVDIEWLAPKDVFEFGDGQTLGWIYDERIPQQVSNGSFQINFKLVADSRDNFIDTDLLVEGSEIGFVMTAFEHDFSETAYEKYTFDGWGHSYMTLQRMKYSHSGYAASMKESGKWVMSNSGAPAFLTMAQDKMMRRWGSAIEYANIFGQGNVSIDGDVLSKDSRGREVMIGSGLLYQGDKAFRYPIHEWNRALLEGMLADMRIKSGKNGKMEVVALMGDANYYSFQRLMRAERILSVTDKVWEMTADGAGLADTYSYYEFGGVRIIAVRSSWFSHPDRPKITMPDGTIPSHWDAVLVSLSNTSDGENGVELITLAGRSFKMGSVSGIDKGGEMANSIDGTHHHILAQSGIVNRNLDGVATMFKPVMKYR